MRLTLRTLLAYMDDILDPSDQEELGRKIEASPFATELIHRSRDAVRRLRLSAPEPLAGDSDDLHSGDSNLDANTAAEYLDNTLSPEAVAEFERNCLEAGPNADMLLAEAASCHHVLTLVLGEPAEVDADLRQRMYALATQDQPQPIRIEPAHQSPAPAAANGAPVAGVAPGAAVETVTVVAAASPVVATRPVVVEPARPEVPDYMLEAARSRRRTRWEIASVAAAALLGGALTWLFWGGEPGVPDEIAKQTSGVDVNSDVDVAKGSEAPSIAATTGDAPSGPAGGDAPTFVPTLPPAVPPGAPATAGAAAGGAPPVPSEAGVAAAPTPTPPVDPSLPVPTDPNLPVPGDLGAQVGIPAVVPPGAGGAPPGAPPTGGAPAGGPPPGVDPAMGGGPGAVAGAPPVGGPMAGGDSAAGDPAAGAPAPGDPAAGPSPGAMATAPPVAPPIEAAAGAPGGVPAAGAGVPPQSAPPGDAGLAAAGPPLGGGAPAPPGDAGAQFGEDGSGTPPGVGPSAPRTLGAYLGLNNDLLLRFDEAAATPAGAWVRLPPRSTFNAGSRLLTLPTFRTHIVLNPDVNAYVGGGSELALLPPGDTGADINIAMPYGRLIINSGPQGNRVAITAGEVTRVIALGGSSSLALEVRRPFLPGRDPTTLPAPLEMYWYLTSGTAEWQDPASVDGEDVTAAGPAAWTTIEGIDQEPATIDELPAWIDKEPASSLETDAREAIAEALLTGEPVQETLLTLTGNTGIGRRTEVRALAARCGTFVGLFEPLVKALADPAERTRRKEQVTALRDAIARDGANVLLIHAAFELQRGKPAAEDLTEMLVGFSRDSIGTTREQVKNGSMVRLVNWLNSDDLTYRVLASHNINEITGTTYLGGYRPEHTAAQRQREMRTYWDRLEKGELLPRE